MISFAILSVFVVNLFGGSADAFGPTPAVEQRGFAEMSLPPPADARPITASRAGGTLHHPVDLCKLMAMVSAGGIYQVVGMSATLEDDDEGNHDRPYTYATLALMEEWSKGAPKLVTARMRGGPLKDPNFIRSSPVSIAVGDSFGFVLLYPKNNKGYAGVDELLIFHSEQGQGFSNGQLFTEAGWSPNLVGFWLKTNFAAKAAAIGPIGSCPLQVLPHGSKELVEK